MKKNIGLFDMALALSVNKINSQFDELLSQDRIPARWGFLTDKSGKHILNEAQDFQSNLNKWTGAFDTELATKIQALRNEIKLEKAKAKPNRDKLDELREELENLEDAQQSTEDFKVYDCALDAAISGYQIQVVPNDSSRLVFMININAGKLYSREYDTTLKTEKIVITNFADCTYAFLVSIGNKIVKTSEMHLSQEDENKLVQVGITDDIFRIEALFMNFQNSNISAYDEQKSIFPKEVKEKEFVWLQVIMNNYFMQLKEHDNHFIVGYKVEPKGPLQDALFNPTAVTYSTTTSQDIRSQAFNFLMQTDNHDLPKELNRGSMPKSLIEEAVDKSNTVNGVFAIDYNAFVNKYIDGILFPGVLKQFADGMRTHMDGFSVSLHGSNQIRCQQHNLWFDLKLESRTITTVPRSRQESQGLEISWDIVIDGNKHEEKEKLIGTVGIDVPFSTHGQYSIGDRKGQKGQFKVILTASSDGKLDLTTQYSQPYIGMNFEKPQYKDGWDKIWDNLNPWILLGPLVFLISKVFESNSIDIKIKNDNFSNFKIDSLSTFSSKVILPGSNTFTFKTVRLLTDAKDEDDAVLFDIAYAPKAGK